MAKRKTIGRDPLAEDRSRHAYSAEIVPMPTAAVAAPANDSPEASPEPVENEAAFDAVAIAGRARNAIGGRLELLGGSLGAGAVVIWPLPSEQGIGFRAPSHRTVDLGGELDAVEAWPDHAEHRYLSALGWAWVLASLGGVVGLVAGGGLRLLNPRRMIVRMRFSDGGETVARTDSVTVSGLQAIARLRAKA